MERSWIYDALEKIVLADLTDRALFNAKLLSRMEAARIVAPSSTQNRTNNNHLEMAKSSKSKRETIQNDELSNNR